MNNEYINKKLNEENNFCEAIKVATLNLLKSNKVKKYLKIKTSHLK